MFAEKGKEKRERKNLYSSFLGLVINNRREKAKGSRKALK
jgi:hypothetical protein